MTLNFTKDEAVVIVRRHLRDGTWLLAEDWLALHAENERLREGGLHAETVVAPDGTPVAAPCAIQGCQYERVAQAEASVARLTQERDDAVKFLGRMAEELLNAGGLTGDRNVALTNLRSVIADRARLRAVIAMVEWVQTQDYSNGRFDWICPWCHEEHENCPEPGPHAASCPRQQARTEAQPMYPCEKCGKLRTKAEGGTTFTVCDDCWNEAYAGIPLTKREVE